MHAGISAKDAIVTALAGVTSKAKDHARAARKLRQALGAQGDAATAEKSSPLSRQDWAWSTVRIPE